MATLCESPVPRVGQESLAVNMIELMKCRECVVVMSLDPVTFLAPHLAWAANSSPQTSPDLRSGLRSLPHRQPSFLLVL